MFSFRNDYSEGAHPRIMEALASSNLEQTVGYGMDPHCENARRLIRERIGRTDADVHFLVGGTQANTIVIAAALRPHQAVIAAVTGHINVHETGAIEATGHKVLAMPSADGKLTPELVQRAVDAHPDEHMVQPKMVYVSQSSEIGTIYSKAELEALRACCDQNNLYLYLDGARLASALAAAGSDVTLQELARLTDAFYIGGTKCGAMFGEAVVLLNDALKPDFRYFIKQRGAMFAKGRLLGIQFECLFQDGLYLEIGAHSNEMAMKLRDGFQKAGLRFLCDSVTNQQFPILPDALVAKLETAGYQFERMPDDCGAGMTCIRFVTSWATPEEKVEEFLHDLQKGL